MLRKIRITLAVIFWVGITLLFLDFTGTAQHYLAWMAKLQFLPAILALNVAVIVGLVILTLLVGRIYCSVICPLGVMQDIIAWVSKRKMFRKKKTKLANKYTYSPTKRVLRALVLLLFLILMIAGLNTLAIFIAPYSAYGRIATNLMQPLYLWANNGLAAIAEHYESYMFYSVDVWMRSAVSLGVAIGTFIIIAILAWRGGRTYCNTICPVGTVLGYVSHFSLFGPVFDKDKCNGCGLCARNCKASCIDAKNHHVDMTRCVTCGDCMEVCRQGAVKFGFRLRKAEESGNPGLSGKSRESEGSGNPEQTPIDSDRRNFVKGLALVTSAATIEAAAKTVDGGLATIEDKVNPERKTPLTPPGALSAKHFAQHCTACQLCIANCPNQVLRPSKDLEHLMQPVMQYDKGYCRPECTRCSEVCPTGAIQPITIEEKSAQQIGHAVWVRKNCVILTDEVECGNCARHCPTGAIEMVPLEEDEEKWVPAINEEMCIGCGACENLCPARPFSAIYVEGHDVHREI